jgi:superfamily II DNA or RNA helicase
VYIPIQDYNEFNELADVSRDSVSDELVRVARSFHESEDMEELILSTLTDPNRTPHGPAELVDIMTVNLTYNNIRGIAGFLLKGKSFSTVKPENISHQIYRLRKLSDLKFAVLGHVGNLLDNAREEFISTAEDIGVPYTILDAVDFARLAIVRALLCPRDGKRLENGRCKCGYRATGGWLNFLQKEALARLQDAHSLGQSAGIVIMPTGSGKTRIAAVDSQKFGATRVLYVAHTHEILDGAQREFEHAYGAHAVYRGWKFSAEIPTPSIHLSTIQGISRSVQEVSSLNFDYLVVDEVHHAAAQTYQTLLKKMIPKFLLGLTATPFRSDQRDVINLCDGNVIVDFELRAGIDGGILVPYQYYGCFDKIDFASIPHQANGYSVRDLNRTLIIPERDAAIVNKWQERAEGRTTLAFCCSQRHAVHVAEFFTNEGIPAAPYLGTTPLEERAKLVQQLFSGELKILCAVDVLNEGVDIPFVECLLFLRPTESKRIFYQQLGRGLRRSPGKKDVIVIDFIANFHNAYRIVEYLGLNPDDQQIFVDARRICLPKDLLNLPVGCTVEFDDRVIDIFARQVVDPLHATRHNIAQILILTYQRTSRRLGHPANRIEVDRSQVLHSGLYEMVFGSWLTFEAIIKRGMAAEDQ